MQHDVVYPADASGFERASDRVERCSAVSSFVHCAAFVGMHEGRGLLAHVELLQRRAVRMRPVPHERRRAEVQPTEHGEVPRGSLPAEVARVSGGEVRGDRGRDALKR